MSPVLEVTCLGEFTARVDGIALPALANSKPLALWLYLAVEGGRRSRAQLAECFWGELGDEAARANLRLALMRLRKLLPAHLEVGRDAVEVPAGCNYHIDLENLSTVAPRRPDELGQLLLLRPEDLLGGLRLRHAPGFDDWMTARRELLVGRYLELLTEAADHLVATRQPDRAVDVLRRCLSLAPWSEQHHRSLIRCYASLGQRASALAQLEACRRALREELDVEPSDETLALVRAINALPEPRADAPIEIAPDAVPGDSGAPLVDRASDRTRLAQLLDDPACRIVSIVGPGGVGKTHLAHRTARLLGPRFADGACVVSLADVEPRAAGQSVTLVEKRIAEALGLRDASTREMLVQVLAERELLLLLDNFEQLCEAAELVDVIALRAPRVRILVTTRRRLGLATEWVVALDGLEVPQADAWSEAAAAHPAVELFVKVAERVVPQFDAAREGADILRICRAVEGLPLALIIAARWLTTLDCRQVAERLSTGFELLGQPCGDDGPAGAGMTAVHERSWAMLSAAQRDALAGLGVFRGGFTTEAAVAVCETGLDVVERIVVQSLIRKERDGRLALHELTRDYAEQKLDEAPDRARRVRARHADYYAARLAAELQRFRQDPLGTDFRETRAELSNLVAALDHFIAAGAIDAMLALLEGLWAFHKRLGWFADGAALLRRGLAVPELPLEPACRLRLWLSDACFQLGHHGEGKEAVLDSLARAGEPVPETGATRYLLRELAQRLLVNGLGGARSGTAGLREDLLRTHNRLAQLYFFEGDRVRFLASALRSIETGPRGDIPEHWATVALGLAHVPVHGLAARYARRSARTADHAEPFARAWAHEQLALYHLGVAELADAELHAARGAELFRALGQHKNWGESAMLHAYPALFLGRLDEASSRGTRVLETARDLREIAAELWSAALLAHLALRTGGDPARHSVTLAALSPNLGRLVDPNTDVLHHGNLAWLAARQGRSDEALQAIATCRRVVDAASMLSIYATNGFIGQVMALVELAAAQPGGTPEHVAALAASVLRDFARFARPFATAAPYYLYCRARWLEAQGEAARGRALKLRALAGLPAQVDRPGFEAGFALPVSG